MATEELVPLGGRDRRRGTVYPSPFFDIAQTYMPPTVKELFRWCQYFFYKDPMIGAVVTKIAEYPVTNFVYNAKQKHVRDGWKELLEDTLNMKPFLIEIGLDYFCLSGDTQVVTRDGVFPIRELAGKTVEVLSKDGVYREASFKSYGEQELYEIELGDGETVFATAEHEWPIIDTNRRERRVTTKELKGKYIVRTVAPRPKKDNAYWNGVRHGIIYGDGTLSNKGRQAHVILYSAEKRKLARYFEDYTVTPHHQDKYLGVYGLPPEYKKLPSTSESASYWYGFVCGFLATDGSADTRGQAMLTQKARFALQAVADQLPRIGMLGGKLRGHWNDGFGGRFKMHYLALRTQFLCPEDFVREDQRTRFEEAFRKTNYGRKAKVKAVRPTGVVEEVFCCVEPETHSFVIGNGILTGNCYGNAFISINTPFIRWVQCPVCKSLHKLADPKFKYKFTNYEFHFQCTSCFGRVVGKIVDKSVRDRTGINFVRWDPKNINIHYNPITGRSKYRYRIPAKISKAIQLGTRDFLVDIPEVFFQALKKKRDIALLDENLFHFKRPTLAEQDMGWGKPLIIHSLGRMFYLYVLRRAQEAIALQRIMPLEFIFPQANAQQDPYQHVNLSSWQGTIQSEIRKWRIDPNYISVIAVPLGFERLGGDGRALLLGPEIEVTNKEITGGMGVPIEFVFGGLSWSGSSVSLRTLENHFLMYRRLLLRFVNWVKNKIRLYLGLPPIDISFTEFKMADDIQRKQIVIQLNAANKISDHTMLTELGFDYDDEQAMIEKETEARNRIQALMMKSQAEAQGEASITQAKYQARAQEAFNEAQGAVSGGQPGQEEQGQVPTAPQPGQPASGQPAPVQPGEGAPPPAAPQGGAPGAGQMAADQQMAQEAVQQQATQLQAPVAGQAGEQAAAGGQVVEMTAARVAKQWANRIAQMPQAQQAAVLNDLRQKMPSMTRLVEQLLAQMSPGQTAGEAAQQMKPLPQVAPPRRKEGPI